MCLPHTISVQPVLFGLKNVNVLLMLEFIPLIYLGENGSIDVNEKSVHPAGYFEIYYVV